MQERELDSLEQYESELADAVVRPGEDTEDEEAAE